MISALRVSHATGWLLPTLGWQNSVEASLVGDTALASRDLPLILVGIHQHWLEAPLRENSFSAKVRAEFCPSSDALSHFCILVGRRYLKLSLSQETDAQSVFCSRASTDLPAAQGKAEYRWHKPCAREYWQL